jgi:hypothetical protein
MERQPRHGAHAVVERDAGTDEAPRSRDKLRRRGLDQEGEHGDGGGCFVETSCAPEGGGGSLESHWTDSVDVLPWLLGSRSSPCDDAIKRETPCTPIRTLEMKARGARLQADIDEMALRVGRRKTMRTVWPVVHVPHMHMRLDTQRVGLGVLGGYL